MDKHTVVHLPRMEATLSNKKDWRTDTSHGVDGFPDGKGKKPNTEA